MDRKAMYKLSYGLFILTAKEAEKDNGCIINTAIQAASEHRLEFLRAFSFCHYGESPLSRSKACHVSGPTMPFTSNPSCACTAFTAFSVASPKIPSSATCGINAFCAAARLMSDCKSSTSAPVRPLRIARPG